MIKTVAHRLFADYLMPSRVDEYEALLVEARKAGFVFETVAQFYRRRHQDDDAKVIVSRHDVDTDVRTCRKLFDVERRHGVKATYYFRLATADYRLMKDIAATGSEVGYHYEEVATFAKQHHLKTAEDTMKHLDEMRGCFIRNFLAMETRLGHKMVSAASHGDFVNRALDLPNHVLLRDPFVRQACGLEIEAYDEDLLRRFDFYTIDRPHPRYWVPADPRKSLRDHHRMLVLTHPRQWETNWAVNTRENALRLYEGITYGLA